MTLLQDQIEKFLPHYLNENCKKALSESLSNYPNNLDNIFMPEDTFKEKENSILQADIFECNDIFLNTKAKVMVISNSCDNDENNIRNEETYISYIPLINLDKYKKLLEKNNISKEKIDSIKKQYTTSKFFIPTKKGDFVALLDRPMHIDFKSFKEKIIKKEYSLNNYGFYIFLFKLSYHFTRIRETTQRY
ncbi:hypothetical protein [Campylobacter pinnipediorum]|uniref:hypothetical protein n=1 Tax=Campylobacter pinnipediorum TaxID=1965231 RepID=UPI0009952A5F|nr:hypothetical protein [Campylobacter pinnipediorum]AQW82318.1 hypothetical protein CPIN17261_0274 [Campylobacter pinnipediorum subsp. pinnipediorum]